MTRGVQGSGVDDGRKSGSNSFRPKLCGGGKQRIQPFVLVILVLSKFPAGELRNYLRTLPSEIDVVLRVDLNDFIARASLHRRHTNCDKVRDRSIT